MTGFILGKKGEQKQLFDENNHRRVVTVVKIKDCFLTQIKSPQHDGYWGVQIASLFKNPKKVNSVLAGQAKKAGLKAPLSSFKEVRLSTKKKIEIVNNKELKVEEQSFVLGQKLNPVELFPIGTKVVVTATSKGKGFAGVVKRYRFAGGPKTHGQSDRERAPGSIGNRTIPGRVFKGKRMAGRMGQETVTIKGLKVLSVTENELILQGLLPGSIHNLILIKHL